VAHAKEGGQLLLEGFTLLAQGEPEIEGAGHCRFHLVFREHPAGVGDGGPFLPGGAIGVGGGAEARVHLAGVLAGEAEDFLLQGYWVGH
jgi:hypothetical protein